MLGYVRLKKVKGRLCFVICFFRVTKRKLHVHEYIFKINRYFITCQDNKRLISFSRLIAKRNVLS